MKKIIATLAGITLLASAVQMPVSAIDPTGMDLPVYATNKEDLPSFAIPMQKSDDPAYDIYARENLSGYNQATGIYSRSYIDVYYKINHDDNLADGIGGERCEISPEYKYAFVTVDESVDMEALQAVLGNERTSFNLKMQENQHAFYYQKNTDYEALYRLKGVEKVELAKAKFKNSFGITNRFSYDDTEFTDTYCTYEDGVFSTVWIYDENGEGHYYEPIERRYYLKDDFNLLTFIVKTDDDVTLTPEMFENTGYNVPHVYRNAETGWTDYSTWYVYVEYTGVDTLTDFRAALEQMDGVQSASLDMEIPADSGKTDYILDEVVNVGDGVPTDVQNGDWLVSDTNRNDIIDLEDVAAYLNAYAKRCSGLPVDDECIQDIDINEDGKMDMYEINYLMERYAMQAAGLA